MPISVDQTLLKAKKYLKNGELAKAEKLYRSVLAEFPKNKRAIEGLKLATRPQISSTSRYPELTQGLVQAVVNLYDQGRFEEAIGRAETLSARFPKAFILFNIIGAANAGLGRFDQAIASYNKALRINPEYAEAFNNMGISLRGAGKLIEAIDSYRKAIQFKPHYAEAHYNLGFALQAKGDSVAAINSYSKALQINPDYAEAHNDLGNLLQARGEWDAAIKSYSKSIKINPGYAGAHNNLGAALQAKGDSVAAIDSFSRALQIKPDYAEAHNNMGLALQDQLELEGAVKSYEKALVIKPDYAEVYRNISTAKKYEADDPLIDQMSVLLLKPNLSSDDQKHLNFALGKALGDVGQYKQAFKLLSAGNRLRKAELGYDISYDQELFASIKGAFQNDFPVPGAVSNSYHLNDKKPIFIFGMPRSGTTLAEQILASHSAVFGAGELDLLRMEVANSGWAKTGLDEIMLSQLRKSYLAGLIKLDASESYITDKMPLNFRWMGFALSALPEAKFIHVQRDARATCWSVFKHYFSSKGNEYAYDLNDVVEYYKMYDDLMSFWRSKFPNMIYDLDYESLVENQEAETRQLLKYVGLDWEDQCLDFHNNTRAVRTASAIQVRQKIYKGSSREWLKYEEYLPQFVQDLSGF